MSGPVVPDPLDPSARRCLTLKVDPARPDPSALDRAAAILDRGGLVAFPTETVYGLGADATDPSAVGKIFAAKGRPASNPLIVHVGRPADVGQVVASWPSSAAALARQFWPGPLSLVLPKSGRIADAVTAGHGTVGVRIPDHDVALALLNRFGRPVAAPSANRSTGVSPTTAGHVLKDLDGRIDLILDAGPTPVGIESTVLDLSGPVVRLLRPGAITADQIGRVLGVEVAETFRPLLPDDPAAASPGRMEVHYSPRTPLVIVAPEVADSAAESLQPRAGLIVCGRLIPSRAGVGGPRVDWLDPTTAARDLYATLHRWDEMDLDVIRVVLPPPDDRWRAVGDRLWRASRRWAGSGAVGPPP